MSLFVQSFTGSGILTQDVTVTFNTADGSAFGRWNCTACSNCVDQAVLGGYNV